MFLKLKTILGIGHWCNELHYYLKHIVVPRFSRLLLPVDTGKSALKIIFRCLSQDRTNVLPCWNWSSDVHLYI